MSEKIYYCESWFRGKSIPLGPMDTQKAEALHRKGKNYTALIGSPVTPSCFVECVPGKGTFVVGFLDAKLREYMSYNFRKSSQDSLFLSMVTHRDFMDDTDRVTSGSMYVFKEDGKLTIRHVKYEPEGSQETHSTFDATLNYEKVPVFGQYEGLVRKER